MWRALRSGFGMLVLLLGLDQAFQELSHKGLSLFMDVKSVHCESEHCSHIPVASHVAMRRSRANLPDSGLTRPPDHSCLFEGRQRAKFRYLFTEARPTQQNHWPDPPSSSVSGRAVCPLCPAEPAGMPDQRIPQVCPGGI